MSTCNRLDLQTLGSPPIVPKNLPDHCSNIPIIISQSLGHHSVSRLCFLSKREEGIMLLCSGPPNIAKHCSQGYYNNYQTTWKLGTCMTC